MLTAWRSLLLKTLYAAVVAAMMLFAFIRRRHAFRFHADAAAMFYSFAACFDYAARRQLRP